MTTILVVSDSHGETGVLRAIIEKNAGLYDRVIHLGDGFKDILQFKDRLPQLDLVLGNMDAYLNFSQGLPDHPVILTIDETIVFIAHGHQFRVHNTMKELSKEARKTGARLALFGHTHERYSDTVNNVAFFNPGAVKNGSYGIVKLDRGRVVSLEHFNVKS